MIFNRVQIGPTRSPVHLQIALNTREAKQFVAAFAECDGTSSCINMILRWHDKGRSWKVFFSPFDPNFLVFRRQQSFFWTLILPKCLQDQISRGVWHVAKPSLQKSICWSICVNCTRVDVDPVQPQSSKHICHSVSSLVVQDFPNYGKQSSHSGPIVWLQVLRSYLQLCPQR